MDKLSSSALEGAAQPQGLGWGQDGLRVAPGAALPEPWTPPDVAVLHCDDDILVLDKPAGLPVHPSSRYVEGTVVGRLRARFGAGFAAPVHRLDRETSGVLICARHRHAARVLSRALAEGKVGKRYWAVCEGVPAARRAVVDLPIATGGALIRIGARIDAAAGRPAQTACLLREVIRRRGELLSLVEARPRQGRRHQVRVHLQALGVPVVGDKIYGPDPRLFLAFADCRLTPAQRRLLRLPRQALHAASVRLCHPGDGRPRVYAAPLPSDLLALLRGDAPA